MAEFNLERISKRLDLMTNEANDTIQSIVRTGEARLIVADAFRTPEGLLTLITNICVLKRYAEAAAAQWGERMDLPTWNAFFEQFERDMHVLPSGKLS